VNHLSVRSSQTYLPYSKCGLASKPEKRESWRCGSSDFLHNLFQMVLPFLEHDKRLSDILRGKAAEALHHVSYRVVPDVIMDRQAKHGPTDEVDE
jgi:hypothetical protein